MRREPRSALLHLVVCAALLSSVSLTHRSWAQPAPQAAPQLTKAPKLIRFVEARYPAAEQAARREASVVLSLALSAEGAVTEATVLESAGAAFDAAALAAVRQFQFEPAEVDGVPAAIRLTYRYDFVLKEEAPTTGGLRGVVRDASGAPLEGVEITLSTGASATTDAAGRFEFRELQSGILTISLRAADGPSVETEEQIEAGRTLEVSFQLESAPPSDAEEDGDDLEIVIRAPVLSKHTTSVEVDTQDAKRAPGTQGDVLKIVQSLPGVARAAAGSGEVVVWGAAPEDTRVYVHGVRVPLLYHFGGLRSTVHSDLVKSVELIPGAYGAAYGRGLGGLVLVGLASPPERLAGSVQIDVLDASAALSGPIAPRLGVSLAVRRSHISDVAGWVTEEDHSAYFTLPKYHDAQARLSYQLSEGESLELGGLLSSDSQRRSSPSVDPLARTQESREVRFDRLDVRYHKQASDGTSVLVQPWLGRDHVSRAGQFGSVPTRLEADHLNLGLRSEWSGRLAPALRGRAGVDFELVRSEVTRAGAITAPPREGDPFVFGRPPADQLSHDRYSAQLGSAAPYGELEVSLFDDQLQLTPGLRLEPYFISASRRSPDDGVSPPVAVQTADVSLQPRLSVRYSPTRQVQFKAGYGSYRQPPLPEDLSSVFGSPTLELASGRSVVFGVRVELASSLSAETTVFHARGAGLAVRSPLASPLSARALVQTGESRSYGSQILLRRDRGDGALFGWVAYTLLRSERRDSPNHDYRRFDFDQTHVLTALGAYDLGAGFDVGVRLRTATGYPRTPVRGAFYDARRDRYEPRLGERNSSRLPAFFQADLRTAKTFTLSGSELEIYLDVQNITGRENAEEIAYSEDYSTERYITGLPLLPVLGARWSFQ